jgi:hypothetical protein
VYSKLRLLNEKRHVQLATAAQTFQLLRPGRRISCGSSLDTSTSFTDSPHLRKTCKTAKQQKEGIKKKWNGAQFLIIFSCTRPKIHLFLRVQFFLSVYVRFIHNFYEHSIVMELSTAY